MKSWRGQHLLEFRPSTLGARDQRGVGSLLQRVKLVAAGLAAVFENRHRS
jgi:hypothetical protein